MKVVGLWRFEAEGVTLREELDQEQQRAVLALVGGEPSVINHIKIPPL